ncbi:MAG TPA: cyclic pyranopterin monophosphate synthase MoaC [Candidatus Hydrogenedentes bacterium]|nr:cyclic pyranopterin monophosphate synthase MoaC [Candidatus Hydrogenedentota bacterium]
MLSHVNEKNQPQMVDVSQKPVTRRTAKARAVVELPDFVAAQFANGELQTKKGPVTHTAIIAGVMAAKKTAELIPFCHPLSLDDCKISITFADSFTMVIECSVAVDAKTGVEMEALTGATVAALTVYDMCKALSHEISVRDIRLVEKRGGKSDYELQS